MFSDWKTTYRGLIPLYILILGFVLISSPSIGQQIQTEFGKNRVQYHDDFDKWWMYETENFIVYWYGKGRNIAQSAIQIAEYVHPDVQNLVEHRINDKIEIIVYTDLSDLLQSNIGNEETFETKHGTTKVIGSRIFLHFDGSHLTLQRKIKEGIAQVYFNAMYSKGSLQEVIDSEPDLEVPNWYKDGFASYAGANWDHLMEDEMRDLWLIHPKRFHKFNRLASDHPRVAGHSMWYYLSQEYGETTITTLLYLMRLRNDLDENIEFIFGFDFKKLKKDWQAFYSNYYKNELGIFDTLQVADAKPMGFKKFWPASKFKLSPDGRSLVYAVNVEGKYSIVHEDENGERSTIFKHGSRNAVQEPDYNYPVFAWHPERNEITICYERRELILLRRIDLTSGEYVEQDIPENLQRVYNLDYVTDDEYLINGMTDGYSDLYIYRSRYRQLDPITEDYYDDIDASYVQLGEQWGVLFASNRPDPDIIPQDLDTILPTNNFDIFFLPIDSDFALRLTQTPQVNERQPKLVNGQFVTYLDYNSGMDNRYVIDLNSRRPPYSNSNLPRNIINHEAVKNSDRYIMQVHQDGAYRTYDMNPSWREVSNPAITGSSSGRVTTTEEIELMPTPVAKDIDPNIWFQSKYEDPPVLEPLESEGNMNILSRRVNDPSFDIDNDRSVIEFIPARAVASRRQFKLEQLTTTVDNSVLFEGLESYTDENAQVQAQQAGILIKGVAKDIFEDFKLELGARIPTTFDGSEFYALFDDRRKRIDKRYAIYRKQRGSESAVIPVFGRPNIKAREVVWLALHRLSYAFDTYRSARLTAQLRTDQRFLLQSSDTESAFPKFDEKRISLKAEYVYDNTLSVDLNLRHGTRYKAYVEFINRFDIQVGNQWNFEASRGHTTVVGFDARHYQPILRNSILAFRGAGATSFGSDKMLYYVGGTDGWLIPKFNEDIPIANDVNYAFKAVAPNLRGFNHNIRNGKSFMVGSAELRIPIFKYLSRRELKSRFLRNIQAVAFVDVGSAWNGFLPSIDDNPLNTLTLQQEGVEVTLNLERSTFVYGYGFGARINLLGYFIRADYAWGVESGLTQDPRFYISMGTDF